MNLNTPFFVIVDDDNYRLSSPQETEAEARAEAEFNFTDHPVTHVCRVCPACGEHEVTRVNTWAYGIETSYWFCWDCDWTGDPE